MFIEYASKLFKIKKIDLAAGIGLSREVDMPTKKWWNSLECDEKLQAVSKKMRR